MTVIPIARPTGRLESFTAAAPDRVSAAVHHKLTDELLLVVGLPGQPGSRAEAEAAARAAGGVISGGLADVGIYQVRWRTRQNLARRQKQLNARRGVTVSAPSFVGLALADAAHHVAAQYEDPKWTWPYDRVNAGEAWQQSTGSNVAVGIIDEGNVFAGHPDLNVVRTLDSIAVPTLHATFVAGLACARPDNAGMVGLAQGCPIVTASVAADGSDTSDTSVLTAMRKAAMTRGVRVVNASLGWRSGCASAAGARKIRSWASGEQGLFLPVFRGVGKNVVWTFSAGNNCLPGVSSPWATTAALPNVVTVAAMNSDRSLASFSNYADSSPAGRTVEVAAPGGVSTRPLSDGLMSSMVAPCPAGYCGFYGARYGEFFAYGTSMAAPIVAGIAALARSKNPDLSADQIGQCITTTAGTAGVGATTRRSSLPNRPHPFDLRLPYSGQPIPIVNAAATVMCATQGGTDRGARGDGTRMVPATGPSLVFEGDTAANPDNGDRSFNDFSSATGEAVDIADTLPADLHSYRCVVLNMNMSFDVDQSDQLAGYLQAGGRIIALGEHSGGAFDSTDVALNSLASTLGATGLSLNDDSYDYGANETTAINGTLLTRGVSALGDDWVSSLTVQDPAQVLAGTADDSTVPMLAEQTVAAGSFVMSGDSNAFSDNNRDVYNNSDNGTLVGNLCP